MIDPFMELNIKPVYIEQAKRIRQIIIYIEVINGNMDVNSFKFLLLEYLNNRL